MKASVVPQDLETASALSQAFDTLGQVDVKRQARRLIWTVAEDTGLPRYVRREASGLDSLAASSPDLVFDRLEVLRLRVLPDLAVTPPTLDYARCVPVEVFWRYNICPTRKELFATAMDYRCHLEALADPAGAARDDLADGVLVPAAHSWLIPLDRIRDLNGAQIKSRLQIDHHPPYLVMIFPTALMRASDVKIREPCGIDTIPARLVHWMPGGVPEERIDQDIPVSALEGLEWRS